MIAAGCFGVCTYAADVTFSDVSRDDYFHESVAWALEQDITTGVDATHFGTAYECTRARAVTFLWRYGYCPEPADSENPFTDTDVNAYYGKAMLGAVENAITNGFPDGIFGPDQSCTRAQIVTFLYRAVG